MAELKPEPTGSLWSNYGGQVPLSNRFQSTMDSAAAATTSSSQHPGRPRSSHTTIDHPYSYSHYSRDEEYDRYPQTSLTHTHSFPNLKRPHPGGDAQTGQPPPPHPPYQEIVQDMRDDAKLTVNHDHKLLSFRRVQDKHTIVDQHGRMQQLELSAQLHGMFFLSEMPTNGGDGSLLQPELTCYRRNLFQISGSLITPRGQLSVILAETGETIPVSNTEVTISAIESVDGHPIRLIVIPWKTPPPNSPELPQTPDQEPPSLPLIPFPDDGQEQEGEYAVYPIGWRRLQFRIATANNGRRKELQQHFVLHLKVMGSLANGQKVALAESTTAPIVVRGRSPRNFQARKEIPLLGSSAGSRGQALVETGLGIVAGPLAVKPPPDAAKLRNLTNLELPRTAFTFNASKIPGSPMSMRSNSYPNWNPPTQLHLSGMPSSGTASYPASTIPADPYQKMAGAGATGYTHEPSDMPLQTSMPSVQLSLASTEQQPPIRTQYAYVPGTTAPSQISVPSTTLGSATGGTDHSALSVPRYVDSNPRPTKSPRHGHTSSITNDATSEYRYGPPTTYDNPPPAYGASTTESTSGSSAIAGTGTPHSAPPRDYYPPTPSWTTTAGEHSTSTVHAYHNGQTGGDNRPYTFADQYKTGHAMPVKSEQPHAPVSYAPAVSHYSWSPT
ncbi:NDT80/PhoG like DNA-binding family protein [Xylariaceae sp. FL1019]|nr:NDT80/PhoG like DNA-binding family protein [Xylariaceae sp. FL1019]